MHGAEVGCSFPHRLCNPEEAFSWDDPAFPSRGSPPARGRVAKVQVCSPGDSTLSPQPEGISREEASADMGEGAPVLWCPLPGLWMHRGVLCLSVCAHKCVQVCVFMNMQVGSVQWIAAVYEYKSVHHWQECQAAPHLMCTGQFFTHGTVHTPHTLPSLVTAT